MIPNIQNDLQNDFDYKELPTKSYKLDTENKKIASYIDKLEAIKQSIYLVLNVERYEYLIYSWNYGVELKDLIGKSISYVIPEVKRRITEAIMQDTRILSVTNFEFEKERDRLFVSFNVQTIFGEVQVERVVNV